MLLAYIENKGFEPQLITAENQELLTEAVWIDLLSPTREEEMQVEKILGVEIPTRDDMEEIELSSRLYRENGAIFMTATMIAQSDSSNPILDPVTFVFTLERLVTIRYIEPQAFKLLSMQLRKLDSTHRNAHIIFLQLLDITIDRLADTLELVGKRLDECSKNIFRVHETPEKLDYRLFMQKVGANGDLNTKARESLVTFNRLIAFFQNSEGLALRHEGQLHITTLLKDISSLSDHATFLSSKVNFLLDATLGMVNIEQNNIIKIFSVAAVIFLPPTLVASIYGMNFHFIPELNWKFGYLFALFLIMIAAWLPYKYFKYRKWL